MPRGVRSPRKAVSPSKKKTTSPPKKSPAKKTKVTTVPDNASRCLAMIASGQRCGNKRGDHGLCNAHVSEENSGKLIGRFHENDENYPLIYNWGASSMGKASMENVRARILKLQAGSVSAEKALMSNPDRVKCRCVWENGQPCPYDSEPGSLYCAIHSNGRCSNSMDRTLRRNQHSLFIPGIDKPFSVVTSGVFPNAFLVPNLNAWSYKTYPTLFPMLANVSAPYVTTVRSSN